ncbi:MAG: SulP family inorganic anion transporter [Chloroflexota bacterium]
MLFGWVRGYERGWLRHDIVAGLVLTAILVPAGMGYAQASGLPAITGLYATILPLLAYAALGPSRILVVGPDSSLAPLIAAAIVPLAVGDPDRAIALAGLLSLITGLLILGAGLANFGFLTDLLSAPVRHGYLNGIALIVIVGQTPRILGLDVDAEGLLDRLRAIADGLVEGRVHGVSLALGGACLAVIVALRHWRPGLPAVLIGVAAATFASVVLDLPARTGIAVVGALPRGLPEFVLPALEIGDMLALVPAALGIVLVSATDTSVLSRSLAARRRERTDQDRELVALGGANVAAAFFSGFPVSSSTSRTPVAESAGARTQLTGVVGAATIALLLFAAPGLLAQLPMAALAAVVVAAALTLVDVPAIVRLWQVRPSEFRQAMASFLGVVLIGVIEGIFLAVVFSLLLFVRRAWRPHDAVLGRADMVKGYHDLTFYPEARQIPGLLLYRFDAPLFFANADVFRDRIRDRLEASPGTIRWVVVAAEPITDIDTTAATMLEELHEELRGAGIVLAFAELKDPVRARLQAYGTLDRLDDVRFFPTVGASVSGYRKETGAPWTDWEESAGRGP